jgi:hypothetical protein
MYSDRQDGVCPAEASTLLVHGSAKLKRCIETKTHPIDKTQLGAFYFSLVQATQPSHSAATNEMDYLQPVPSVHVSLGPTRPRHDLAVMLDRHPVALQSQFSNQPLKARWLWKRLECARLPIK